MRRSQLVRGLIVALLLQGMVLTPASGEETATTKPTRPLRVALMVPRDISDGWVALPPEAALRRGCGELLIETLAELPAFEVVNWSQTCGVADLVASGLYRFPNGPSHAEWSKLLPADIFVEYSINTEQVTLQVHAPSGTKTETIRQPLLHPKKTVASLTRMVFDAANYTADEAFLAELNDPETRHPALFISWMSWIGYSPSPWNSDNPYGKANATATEILAQDPAFRRGVAWAAKMRLMPVASKTAGRTMPACPDDFDLRILTILDNKRAHFLIPYFHKRMLQSEWLRKEASNVFSFSALDLESTDLEMADETDADEFSSLPLEKTKQKTYSERVRLRVIEAFRGLNKTEVIQTLFVVAEKEESPAVRAAATGALAAMPSTPGVEDALMHALDDPDARVRLSACRGWIKQKYNPATLFPRMLADASTEVQVWALQTLPTLKTKTPDVYAGVLQALSSDNAEVRVAALRCAATCLPNNKWNLAEAIQTAINAEGTDERRTGLEVAVQLNHALPVQTIQPHLKADDPSLQTAALKALHAFHPDQTLDACTRLINTPDRTLQATLATLLGSLADQKRVPLLETLLSSTDLSIRETIRKALYLEYKDNPEKRIRLMLGDQSMRVNAAALRLLASQPDTFALPLLTTTATAHPNEYIRADALARLDLRAPETARTIARASLTDPYFVIRLCGAAILSRTATAADTSAIQAALAHNREPWLTAALEDALAKSTGKTPERIRLKLGKRTHVEGGETPNGWQCWLGTLPKTTEDARQLVRKGYRFGVKTIQTNDKRLWQLQAIDNHRSNRNVFLLDLFQQLHDMRPKMPYLYYLCLFDEPMGPWGGDEQDSWRAFALESSHPEWLDTPPSATDASIQRAFAYWKGKRLGDVSNWVVGICRNTIQREFPDLRIFPQSLSYMGVADAFERIDADGDYTWRYDGHNLMGDYGQGAINRALRPGKPVGKITWLGAHRPNILRGDRVFTDTKFPTGPWRFRNYIGTRSALALYVSGVEAGFFNWVAYASIVTCANTLPGRQTYPLTPHSADLRDVIETMMKNDATYWKKRALEFEAQTAPPPGEMDASLIDGDNEDIDIELEEKEPEQTPAEKMLATERQKHFDNAMTGCSYMNIFNADVTRAMANLPSPKATRSDTLIILPRDAGWSTDRAHFLMPAMALLSSFDLVPTYDCLATVDLSHYDTILLLEGTDGVTPALVSKINHWLRTKENGFLYLCGNVNSKTPLFAPLTGNAIDEPFLWEKTVRATARTPVPPAAPKQARKRSAAIQYPPIATFTGNQKTYSDPETQLRTTYEGNLTALLESGGNTVLGRWTPPESSCTVVFDGATHAGPAYTEALETIILALDRERGSHATRNRYWGHVTMQTPGFLIDVATSGYASLQAARPRHHKGVDIITGVIHPTVKHGEAALILTDYVGPYAGARGDWAAMARTELTEMTLLAPARLRIHAKGVTRVTHIGPQSIALEESAGFKKVETQLDVWKEYWQGQKAYALQPVDGGMEFHFSSPEPVVLIAK